MVGCEQMGHVDILYGWISQQSLCNVDSHYETIIAEILQQPTRNTNVRLRPKVRNNGLELLDGMLPLTEKCTVDASDVL